MLSHAGAVALMSKGCWSIWLALAISRWSIGSRCRYCAGALARSCYLLSGAGTGRSRRGYVLEPRLSHTVGDERRLHVMYVA